jgi:prophage antirepressor-like protein
MQMTKALTIFKFKGKSIRILPDERGELLYCIRDICDSIEIKKVNDVIKRLTKGTGNSAVHSGKEIDNTYLLCNTDTDNNGVASSIGTVIIDTPTETGLRPMAYTDEVGLYDIISRSRKPIAKIFHRQLLGALPVLRKLALRGKESTGRSTPEITSTEQVIIDTNNRVKALERTVSACLPCMQQNIAKIQADQMIGVKLLKAGTLPQINDIDWRARLNQDIRNISVKFNWPEHDCWNMVYYEDKYRNHRDIKAIARNRGCRPIQVAEDKGWLSDLCAIAQAILSGEIVSSYRIE